MAAILDAILDFEECQQGISGDFLSVILYIFLDLSWKNQLVTKNVQVKTNIIGLLEPKGPIWQIGQCGPIRIRFTKL